MDPKRKKALMSIFGADYEWKSTPPWAASSPKAKKEPKPKAPPKAKKEPKPKAPPKAKKEPRKFRAPDYLELKIDHSKPKKKRAPSYLILDIDSTIKNRYNDLLKMGYVVARVEEKHKKNADLIIDKQFEMLKQNKNPNALVVITPGCVVVKSMQDVYDMFEDNDDFQEALELQEPHEMLKRGSLIDLKIAKIKLLEDLEKMDIVEANNWAILEGGAYVDEDAVEDGEGINISVPTITELRPRVRYEKSKKMISDEIKQEFIDRDLKHAKYVAFDPKTGKWSKMDPFDAADLLNFKPSGDTEKQQLKSINDGLAKRFKSRPILMTRPYHEGQNVELVVSTKIYPTADKIFDELENYLSLNSYEPVGNIPPEAVETDEFTEVADGADDIANMQDLEEHLRTPNNINEKLQPMFSREADGGDSQG
jgi:hypothetical protein